MYNSELNTFQNKVIGNRGVFAFIVTKRELPTALPNYEIERNKIAQDRKQQTFSIFNAIKEASNVEDERSLIYGAN